MLPLLALWSHWAWLAFSVLLGTCTPTAVHMITYLDQNNNQYRLSAEELRYQPVTPQASSSGTYSGGEPAVVQLPPEAWPRLLQLSRALMLDQASHAPRREMLTARLTIEQVGSSAVQQVLLYPSEKRAAWEAYLRSLHRPATD